MRPEHVDRRRLLLGDNTYGQLGNGTNTSSSTPVQVKNSSGALNGKLVTSVTAGYYHACALDTSGVPYCWGQNSNGQLGNGSTTNSTVPVRLANSGAIKSNTVVARISAGGLHTCAVDSGGNAYCWGQNSNGQLGTGSLADSNISVAITYTGLLTPGTVTQITSGAYHTCALNSAGLAYCWGSGQYGQRGDNSLTGTATTPVAVNVSGVLAGKTLTQITGGTSHTCAIDSTGLVYCWGLDSSGSGQVGDNGTATVRSVPVYVYSMAPTGAAAFPGNASATVYWTAPGFLNGTLTSYTATTSPGSFTCTSTSATTCTITGLTNGTTYSVTVTVTVTTATGTSAPSTAVTVTPTVGTAAISAGYANSCALQSGKAYCWGDNTYGEAGNNTTSPATQPSPVAVYTGGALSGVTLTQVDAGDDFACGLSSAGAAYCWGENNDGQLGNNSTTNSSVPVAVTTSGALSGVTLTALSASRYTMCALSSAGTVYCWGADDFGQLGNGGTDANSSVPVAVTTSGTPMAGATIVQISTGWEHACALSSAGAVYCWGDNTYGELGNGTTTSSSVPVATTNNGVAASSVSAGWLETCGLSTAGAAFCWGNDQYGQLGNGTTGTSVSTASPVTASGVLSGVTVTQISVGQGHVCALGATGAAYCWGYDAYGQLGNNSSTSPVNTPVAVYTGGALSGVSLAQISAGNTYTCAQSAAGTSYCWGSGASGELGNNNGSASALAAILVGPQAPVSVTATAGAGSAAVSWTAPAYLNNGTLTSYTATASPGSATCTSTSATSCTVTGLTGGTLYTITVTTTATTGTSAPSVAATVTPLGSLTSTTPASLAWSGTSNGANQSIVDGVAGDQQVSVTDASGTGAGWHITMSATTVTAGSRTLPSASALFVNGSVTSLTGVAPSVACVGSCTLPTNKTTYPVAITTAASSPSAFTIYDTAAATGVAAVTIGGSAAAHPLGWWVNVPASAYVGFYTSTITIGLISGP